MQSETTPETQAVVIPDERDVQATGLGGAWRFANGKIRRGRQGAFEDRSSQKVVGLLRRVGVHSGKRESDGVMFSQAEADIETANGLEHFKSSLTDDEGRLKPSSATVGLVWGLLQFGKDEQIMLTVSEADFTTEKGGKPTFVNAWKAKNADWRFEQCIRPKRDKNAPKVEITDQWLALEAQFRAHSAFAERATRDDDDSPSHLSELEKECAAKGWPTPSQHPGAWLAAIAKASQHETRARLSDYEDSDWGEIRLKLQPRTERPEWLKGLGEVQKSIDI